MEMCAHVCGERIMWVGVFVHVVIGDGEFMWCVCIGVCMYLYVLM